MKINVGFLLAYDYSLLKLSLQYVYRYADKIVLAVDQNLKTWAGNRFEIDDDFFDWLNKFDVDDKIKIYRDNFYMANLSAMENETRERNMLATKMGEGFCIQLDADEFVIDFEGMCIYLKQHENKFLRKNNIQICAYWIDVYKKIDNGFLLIKETTPFYLGTNSPNYIRGRKNRKQQKWYIPFQVMHLTWGRSEEELRFKVNNWGHNNDFDGDKYVDFWKSINVENYMNQSEVLGSKKSFHPFNDKLWKELIHIKANSILELFNNKEFPIIINEFERKQKNIGQKVKYFFR